MRNGAAITHTVVMGNLLSTDQSTLYLDANSGFDAGRPITVFTVVTTRLGNAVTFKEVNPSAILSNFTVPRKLFGDAPFVLTAPTTNSDGAFTYSSSNLAVATVSGSTVTIVGTGSTTITATQAATATYGSNSISTTLLTTPIILELDSNGVTIKYTGNAADVPASSALFVQEYVRGTVEWFAVVKDGMKSAIYAYASGTNGPFIPSGQTVPVPFNNIVTTLMTDLSTTFISKTAFNQAIGSWDTANVTTMNNMFSNATNFNQPIASWNTANVSTMNSMFQSASTFNQPIGSWNTSKVTTMNRLFVSANAFNQPIGSWNTANVTDMMYMFGSAYAFNQAINSWNTAKVTSMSNMFVNAFAFNQPIGSWNTANVVDMSYMFYRATAFNQNISAWNVALVANFAGFRTNSALVVANMPAAFYPAASLSGFSVPSKMFGDAPFVLTAPTSNSDGAFTYSSSNPAVATVSGSTVTIVSAGSATITATQTATFNYNTNSITASFVVSKATPSLSNFSVASKTFGDAPFALTAPTSNSDGAFTYSSSNETVATISGSTVTIVGTGTTTITATQAATATYASNSITATFTVTVPSLLSLDSNGVTITYNGNAADVPSSSALFIQADPRGTGSEWFAVVKNGMKSAIQAYAEGTNDPFIPSGQTVPVPFNNIVTTLMTDMSYMFNAVPNFNHEINSWDTSNVKNMIGLFGGSPNFNRDISAWNVSEVTNMSSMFYIVFDFNQNISGWNTAKVTNMASMFYQAYAFNQDISGWNVALVTDFANFRTDSALVDANMPAAFLP